uniref:DDE-1 domain-containing protein n=1 Tax=Hyaloperonospora arabidopsidis (strain Emoy2) TaxID=559515 RepID=M4BGG3_HYAAE
MHGRRVLLLLDNASSHYGTAESYNVELEFLSPNRQHICNRSTQVVRWLLDAIHIRIDRKLDILEVVRFTISSWEEVSEQVIRNCWSKCVIMGAVKMADLTQLRDYNKRIERFVEDEQTKHMEGLTCGVSVSEYIIADDDEPIECDSDVIEHEAIERQ